MEYKFYVKMDGDTYGPYSAKEVRDLQLMDDILVTEESMSEWLPAGRFDFDDMVNKELGALINENASINRSSSNTMHGQERYGDTSYRSEFSHNPNIDINIVPNEIKGWNWGAFFFNWIWGLFNGVYWAVVILLVNLIPFVGQFIALVLSVVLGIKGNEWSWKAKSWGSVEEFKSVQHNWAIAIFWVLGIVFCLTFISGFLASII